MYKLGDKIVYPMHGAGVIEDIEEKLVLGEVRKYYVLHVPYGDMKIIIPCEACEQVGVRDIIDRRDIAVIEAALKKGSTQMSGNWNRRYRENMEKLKTGDLCEVCEVLRNLMRADRVKKLSSGEKKMMNNARQILVSELILVSEKNADEITVRIEELVFGEGTV
jgi:CarD family transcriptional regulator